MSQSTQWVQIPGFPDYAVSRDGEVINVSTHRVLSPRLNSYGYSRVALYKDGERFERYAHALVAEAFGDNRHRPTYRFVRIKELPEVFNTVEECAAYLRTHPSPIYRVLRGERKTHLGFSFEYFESDSNEN